MNEVLKTLRANGLVKIVVGENDGEEATVPEIFFIQRALLETASEYFKKVIKDTQTEDTEQVTLNFPEDDVDAWKMMLFWLVKGDVPSLQEYAEVFEEWMAYDRQLPLVRCWVLGEKFQLPGFQNGIMAMLQETLSGGRNGNYLNLQALQKAFRETNAGSELRLFAAEDIARQLEVPNEVDTCSFEDDFGDVAGFAGEIVDAVLRRHGNEMKQNCESAFPSPSYRDVSRFVKPVEKRTRKKRKLAIIEGQEHHEHYEQNYFQDFQ
ncbi:hypothetical protein LTR97_003578 [Elasticomyces elasticus]|uniref:BTB domain-containing protein n=1 Tax=Elasticomyces elasticus TaxID=574655 RepID=A0AAN7ZP98_9PEZI|nr:hypothetical protein LTR97_003578 [Elasticomyces elasticus]